MDKSPHSTFDDDTTEESIGKLTKANEDFWKHQDTAEPAVFPAAASDHSDSAGMDEVAGSAPLPAAASDCSESSSFDEAARPAGLLAPGSAAVEAMSGYTPQASPETEPQHAEAAGHLGGDWAAQASPAPEPQDDEAAGCLEGDWGGDWAAQASPAPEPQDDEAAGYLEGDWATQEPPPTRGQPFSKGVSGNPAGRPKGSRNRMTRLAEWMLEESTPPLMHKAIELGKDGNIVILRFLISEILKDRERSMPIDLQPPKTINQLTEILLKCADMVVKDEMTDKRAKSILEVYGRVIDTAVKYRVDVLGGKNPR